MPPHADDVRMDETAAKGQTFARFVDQL